MLVSEKTENLLNKFNQTGFKADLSGVGLKKHSVIKIKD